MKIVTIIGARPQFIKASVLSRLFLSATRVEEIIVHTGQHFDSEMSEIFFKELGIPSPKYNLGINGLTHGAMTGMMLVEIEKLLLQEQPSLVLVYGDTNSTLAGALAAKKIGIKVAHVEAGLRSFNMAMPEEINRIITDRISDLLFCPTDQSVNNLLNEGFNLFNAEIFKTGDIMYDAALNNSNNIHDDSILESLGLMPNNYILATLHRQENTDDYHRINQIVGALNELHKLYTIVLPLHPRTKKALSKYNLSLNVKLINPVRYGTMIALTKNSRLVITDSGGLQKEAFFFNKFCLTIRDETEWIELVERKVNFICGAEKKKIKCLAIEHWDKEFPKGGSLYGDGTSGLKMLEHILRTLEG